MSQKITLCFSIISLCFWVSFYQAYAQEGTSSEAGTGWKEEIKTNAQEARQEERQLRDQIHKAVQAGDMETAKSLKEQLKAVHRENVQQKHQDMQAIKESRQELKQDVPAGTGPKYRDRIEDVRDRREDVRDKHEDVRDRKEDVRDRKENVRDRREDKRDKREDFRDKRQGSMQRSGSAGPKRAGGGKRR